MGVIACYNGNISCATYNYNGTYRTYDYSYDALNRLLSSVSVPMTSGYPTSSSNRENFTYDKQGNIKTLTRQSGTTSVDNLVMTYSGNQVKSITDASGSQGLYNVKEYQNKANTTNEMSYDKNGNMTKDLDRDIVTIRYNILNLPDTIQFKYGNQIINRYAADGSKLYTDYFTKLIQLATPIDTGAVYSWVFDRSLYNVNSTYYVGNMEYTGYIKTNGTRTRSLQRVHNPEGYTNNFNNPYMSAYFYYFRRDHLGNTREVWQAPSIVYAQGNTISPASVVQRTQYYPSGLPWSEGLVPGWQPYKYNGKEFVEMHGLDEYDSQARSYYPAIMRTTTIDPLAEKYFSISPYAWCGNNPVRFIDPTGMYFDESNEKRARKLERQLDKQLAKLEKEVAKIEKKGGDTGDRKDRIAELKNSKSDISDMRSNESVEFRYGKASGKDNLASKGNPVTAQTGTNDNGHNIVTMYSDGVGSQVHESRHGGQVARGEYSFDQRGNPTAGYGIGSEVSAYRAQYSYDGKLTYLDASNALNQQMAGLGIMPPPSTLTNIGSITPNFVRTQIGEFRSVDYRGKRIYGLTLLYLRLP